MGEVMQEFTNWKEFIESYTFKDSQEIYTNGADLVPLFRVEQMMELHTNKIIRQLRLYSNICTLNEEEIINKVIEIVKREGVYNEI